MIRHNGVAVPFVLSGRRKPGEAIGFRLRYFIFYNNNLMPNKFKISDCNILHLNPIHNRAGNIAIVENGLQIPFDVKRVYYLYDIPAGETRGGHAHKELEQFVIAVSGSFDITLDDGMDKKTESLRQPMYGLHIKPGIWRDISNFSSGSVCIVLAAELYNEDDYIRDYNKFLAYRK